ncbi:hypothetical protein DY000_02015666 [Brassica cretica]|uniref:Uncharacterized protein n=1 Tax=Brassica cretica TaxID=69181 RepID=A0ABQ7CME2_BRACR|nr:hypothetical protein DY000_02015666 [Brassica cretica]
MLITIIRLNLIEFGRDEVEAMIDPLLHAQIQRKEKEEGKGLEKNACVFRIPYGVRVQVSFGRYSQGKAYTFYLRNEVSRGVCWAVSVEL